MEKPGIVNLNVNTSSKTPKVETKIRFSSLDTGTAKLIFNVTKDGVPLPLSAAKGILDLRMMDGSTFDELPVKIKDATKGVLEYTLTTDQLKHAGTVQAELSVFYETGQGMSISKFEFKIEKALRNQDIAVKAEHYISELKDITDVVNSKAQEFTYNLDKFETDFESRTAAVEEKVNSFESNVGQSTVVQVDAAKKDTTGQTHADLDSRIKAEVGRINQKQEETTAALAERVKKVNGKTPDANGEVTIEVPQVDTSKLATKQELQNIGSATPKGTFATVTALQTAFPSGTTGIYVVQADGNWYYWNGTAWVTGGLYQSKGIAEKAVTYKNTDFFELDPNINLYNNKDYIYGATLQPISNVNSFYKTNDGSGKIAYLKIKPNTQYTVRKEANTLSNGTQFKYATASFLYDVAEGNKPIDGLYVTRNNSTFATFITNATDQYLFIYFDNDINAQCYIQVLEGTKSDFVAKKIVINPSPDLNVYTKDDLKSVKEIEKNVNVSKNLFNRNLPMTKGHAILVDGTVSQNSDYNISGKYYLEKGKTYSADPVGTSFTGFNSVAFYDAQDKFIKRVNITSTANTFMTTPETEYVRFNVGRNEYNAMVNEGTTLLPYEPFGVSIETDKQKEYIKSILESSKSLNRKYVKPPFDLNEWYEKLDSDSFNSLDGVSYDRIYQFYDELVSDNPSYISRKSLGNDQSGTYPIYSYTFKPTRPSYEVVGVQTFDAKLPKVIISTGLHGSEKPAILTLANIMKDISDNWQSNKTLEWLRFNVEFIIIPLLNPWGYVNNKRGNVNHVDINRNFDYLWDKQGSTDPTDDRYKGTAPNSEKETQYMKSLFESNPDTVFYYDFHTLGSGAATWDLLYRFEISSTLDVYPISQVAEYVTTKTMISGQKNHNVPSDSGHLGKVSIGTVTASAYNYASKIGIMGCAPEVAYNYVGGEQYTEDVNKLNTEYMLNSITVALKELL